MSQPTPDPATPIEAYTQIIDELVNQSRVSVAAQWVVEKGVYTNAPADRDRFNTFVAALTPAQRQLLAEMLQGERDAGVFETLSLLNWWIECAGLNLTWRGQPVWRDVYVAGPIGVSGSGMHGDFIVRRDGWTWPKDPQQAVGMTPPDEPPAGAAADVTAPTP